MNIPFYNDAQVASALDFSTAQHALDAAFADLADGRAQVLARKRVDCGPVKLSVMGGIWLARNLAGVKSYPTVNGQFSFTVNLYDLARNEPVAVLAGCELTRLRTAAMVALVASRAAHAQSRKLAVVGAGVQGRSIAAALCALFRLEQVCVADPALRNGARVALPDVERSGAIGMAATVCDVQEAVREADIVVTATRSKAPVFSGDWLKPGAFVAAIGTSLPNGRELDDLTLAQAAQVIVEWKEQSLLEAGEIVLGKQACALADDRITDLGELYRGERPWRNKASDVVVFKSVGVGLADVAAAGAALQKLSCNAPAQPVAA